MKDRWLAGLALVVMLGTLALSPVAAAQVEYGDLHATASGQLTALYNDSFGNLEGTDAHSLGFAGRGAISGDYYNPNFFSFTLLPYYGRSQDNSDMQSISDASGYTGTLNIFKGSHFPGVVTFDQTWNSTGTFGIPDVTGLATKINSHGLNVVWSALLPNLPTLSVGYGQTGGTNSLLGSDESTTSSTKNFNVGSTYSIGDFYLTGGFIHLDTDVGISGLEDGESETARGSSNQYRLTGQGRIPYRTSSASLSLSRISYNNDDTLGGTNYGTTDTVNGNVNLAFPRAPVQVTTTYTDNLLGSIEQQMVSNGEVPLAGLNTPESRSVTVGASTFVNVFPRTLVGAYVSHTQEYFDGQNFGVTQLGVNVSYNFLHTLKGLMLYGGLVESATQQGNTRLGFIGNVSYNRYLGKWEINSFVRYDQDVETLLVMYTTSTLNYGGTLKRQLPHDVRWVAVANLVRSVFEQQAGNASHGESYTTMLIWSRASVSGIYTKSNGTSILTATGLATTPVPTSVLAPGNSILYNGSSYGANLSVFPVKHMAISTAWSKSLSNTASPSLLSNGGNTNYYGLATYEYRKLLFQAGVTKFKQSISTSGTPPTMLTSYSFGISRWFKGF
jgi:hypothetical protein